MGLRRTLFYKHLARQRGPVAAAAIVLLLQALLNVAMPWPLRFVLNQVLSPAHRAAEPEAVLAGAAAWLAALCAAAAALAVAQEYWMARAVNGVVSGVRSDLTALLLSRRQSFADRWPKAEVVGRISADAANLEGLLAVGLPTLLEALPTLAMILAVVARLERAFALGMLAMVLAMVLLTRRFSAQVRGHEKLGRRETNRFEVSVYQTLEAFPLVKSLALEEASFAASASAAARVAGHLGDAQVCEGYLSASIGGMKSLMRLMLVLCGGRAVLAGRLSVGDLVLFLSYVESVTSPVRDLSKFSVKRAKALIGIERIEELIAEAGRHPEADGTRELAAGGTPALDLCGVSFAYPGAQGAPVLRRLSAGLRPGDLVAVAGPSGSGKSTFLKLLNRLLEPSEGEVLLGGAPLPEYRLRGLRERVTLIPQETLLLAGTVRENLRAASRAPLPDAALWAALERAAARGFVAALPGGLDARVGEGGLRLSGGEERRLSVARAFLRPSSGVFAFDEPTSGLDPAAAGVLVCSLRALAGRGACVLWATHRVSELAAAGRVLFLAPERRPALGRHEDLLKASPAYAAFVAAAEEPLGEAVP